MCRVDSPAPNVIYDPLQLQYHDPPRLWLLLSYTSLCLLPLVRSAKRCKLCEVQWISFGRVKNCSRLLWGNDSGKTGIQCTLDSFLVFLQSLSPFVLTWLFKFVSKINFKDRLFIVELEMKEISVKLTSLLNH
jgi:hypothetical protein